jgi:hypothetical protein
MRAASYVAIVLVAFSLTPATAAETAVDRAKEDEIVAVPKGDPDMAAAFRQARETLKTFLDLARTPRSTITSMAVKVAVRDAGETEYFWISPFSARRPLRRQDQQHAAQRPQHQARPDDYIQAKRCGRLALPREWQDVRQLYRLRLAQARAAVGNASVQAGIWTELREYLGHDHTRAR